MVHMWIQNFWCKLRDRAHKHERPTCATQFRSHERASIYILSLRICGFNFAGNVGTVDRMFLTISNCAGEYPLASVALHFREELVLDLVFSLL